jgi:hypothetical protein
MRTKNNRVFLPRLAVLLAVTLLAAGCNDDVPVSTTSTASTSSAPSGSSPPAASVQLSGTPAASVTAGNAYSFKPTVAAGGTVTFSVHGQPAWMTFDSSTGALTGTPTTSQEGSTGQITITGSNGTSSASIGPFTVQVNAPPKAPAATPGSAALSWIAPTHNTDGSLITDLSGYHIYYGTEADALTTMITVDGGASTTYTVNGLSAGTYFFSVVAYNAEGMDSPDSNLESKTI